MCRSRQQFLELRPLWYAVSSLVHVLTARCGGLMGHVCCLIEHASALLTCQRAPKCVPPAGNFVTPAAASALKGRVSVADGSKWPDQRVSHSGSPKIFFVVTKKRAIYIQRHTGGCELSVSSYSWRHSLADPKSSVTQPNSQRTPSETSRSTSRRSRRPFRSRSPPS